MVKPNVIEVRLLNTKDESTPSDHDSDGVDGIEQHCSDHGSLILALPWAAQTFSAVKGVLHTPEPAPSLNPEVRDGLLTAIAKARGWLDDLLGDRAASFAEIAAREGKTERYIRLLASLAFTSPRIIAALIDGTARPDLTVAGLARALQYSWAEQERQFGLPRA